MATVNLGSIKFKWKGTYSGATAYTIDDVVSYNGSSYICIQASTGNLPTDTAYFEQMSSAGTNGTDGTDLTTTLTTQGDIVYRNASGLARLGAGTSGQALITNGTGANPSWGDVSGGLLQVVTATDSTARSTNSSSFVTASNTLSVNITPSSTSSKIYLNVTGTLYQSSSGYSRATIYRDGATNLGNGDRGLMNVYSNPADTGVGLSMSYLDSPNTTSQVNYQVYILSTTGNGAYLNENDSKGVITAFEIGV